MLTSLLVETAQYYDSSCASFQFLNVNNPLCKNNPTAVFNSSKDKEFQPNFVQNLIPGFKKEDSLLGGVRLSCVNSQIELKFCCRRRKAPSFCCWNVLLQLCVNFKSAMLGKMLNILFKLEAGWTPGRQDTCPPSAAPPPPLAAPLFVSETEQEYSTVCFCLFLPK